MNATAAAEPHTMKTVTKRQVSKKVREVHIEPAANGYTVHVRHHNDFMEPGSPAKPKVFEKAHGHEMLNHVAKKLGIKAKITEAESAAEDAGENGEE